MIHRLRNAPGSFALALILLLGACAAVPATPARIQDIRNDPRTYVDKTVKIAGEVTDVFSVVVLKYFTVNDGTGSMNVVTDQVLPRKGQRIEVTGKVAELFAFGSEALLVILEEKGGSPGSTTAAGTPDPR